MDVRRMLAAVAAGIVGAAVAAAGVPAAAYAAPAAPKGYTVVRAADNPYKVVMSWKAVTDADHYTVDVIQGDIQTVVTLPAGTTSYTLESQDPCVSYKLRVGASDANGDTTSTGYYTVKSLAPGYVMGMAPGREAEGTIGTVSWRTPGSPGYTPITGYHVVFSRLSDGVVLVDSNSLDMSYKFPGIDPARAYLLTVSAQNQYGSCATAKSLMDRYRPADPTSLLVTRRADAPNLVEVSWKPAKSLPVPTYYMLGHGQTKMTTVRVDAPSTSATLNLDATQAWTVQVKAYNVNGGSGALTGTVPVWDPTLATPAPAPTTTTPTTTTPTTSAPAPSATVPTADPTAPAPATSEPAATPEPATSEPSVSTPTTEPTTEPTTTPTTEPSASPTAPPVATDVTPPTITASLSEKAVNGWFRNPVTVHFTCADEDSGSVDCPADITVSADGAGQSFTGTATDQAGNTASATVTVSLDRTVPDIAATIVGDVNGDGWFTTPPTVHYTCADTGSTLVSCPADVRITNDGAGQIITGTTVDKAGNTAGATVTVNIDQTAPAITATVTGGEVSDAGWYQGPVTVHYTCTDDGSGIAECPEDTVLSTDGAAQSVTGTAVDKAGNTATTSVDLDIDRTAPAITATVVDSPNAAGWHRTAPTVHFTCTDEGSGIAGCPEDTVLSTEGTAQTVTGTATDNAGNTAGATVTVNIDRTAPAITATVVGTPNDGGWYRGPVTVHYTCGDDISGVTTCPADEAVSADGTRTVTGTAVDAAGNTADATVTVTIDQTAPAVVGTVVGQANAAGWYRTAPTVSYACTDTGSGIADCPADKPVTTDGTAQAVTGTATDKAGNAGNGSATTINLDQAAPSVTAAVVGTPNTAGWYRTAPTVSYACTDTGSGIADCPADKPATTDGTAQAVTGTATDKAGNAGTGTAAVNLDRGAPKVTVAGVVNGATYGAKKMPTVTCDTTDAVSGVATKATMSSSVNSRAKYTVTCTGGTDKAGNAAAPVTVSYSVVPNVAWLTELTHSYLSGADDATRKFLDTRLSKGQTALYAMKVLGEALGRQRTISLANAAALIYWATVLDAQS